VFANPGAGPAYGAYTSLSGYLDAVIGASVGGLIARTSTGWAALAAGASNNLLVSSGTLDAPVWDALAGLLDTVFGASQGNLLYRSGTGWAALAPGSVDQVLLTGGATANPAWGTVAASLGYTPVNRAGDTFTGAVGLTVAATVVAAGTTQGTATALTAQQNIITSATTDEGVIHALSQGKEALILNRSGADVLVYPPVGVQWESQGANVAILLPTNGTLRTLVTSSTQGYVW
jgi:hypothetical protein